MQQYDFYIETPNFIKEVLSALHTNGFEAYIVGGSVRDSYLGRELNDFDITTNAKPSEMIELFSPHFKVIQTGIKHGTLTVVGSETSVEVTTYRIDGDYVDNRRPENVVFTSQLFEDLKRRDFTINALVYADNDGIIDYFGGIGDINKRIIKCIGAPSKRFNEDALRILRAIRFSAKLDFDIESDTESAIHLYSHLLENISGERIYSELKNFFLYDNINRISELLVQYKDVLEYAMFSSLCTPEYKYTVLQNIDSGNDLRFKVFLCLVSKDLMTLEKILTRLKVSNAFKKDSEAIYEFINNKEYCMCESLYSAKKCVSKYGKHIALVCAKVVCALNNNSDLLYYVKKIISDNMCTDIKSLAVCGDDLIKTFAVSGKTVGYVLNQLLLLVMKNEVPNEKEALIEKANNIINTMPY